MILFGVPQGSVIRPILLILYNGRGVWHHCCLWCQLSLLCRWHAGGRQCSSVHGWCRVTSSGGLHYPARSVDVKNRLKLNADKTQLIWLGTRQQLAKLNVTELRLTSSVVEFDSTVTDLGVVLDNQLSMQAHVAAVCRSCFYQLRQLRVVQRSLTRDVLQSLASTRCILLPRVQTSTEQRSFAYSGPAVWNSLPPALCENMSLPTFKTKLTRVL